MKLIPEEEYEDHRHPGPYPLRRPARNRIQSVLTGGGYCTETIQFPLERATSKARGTICVAEVEQSFEAGANRYQDTEPFSEE